MTNSANMKATVLVTVTLSVSAAFRVTPPYLSTARNRKVVMSKKSSSIEYHDDDVRIVHMNHAGASPSPSSVLERVISHMKLEQRLGGYAAAQEVQEELQEVYKNLARLLHASSTSEVALVESATVAWTRLFYSMIQYKSSTKKKIILVSEAEYAANLVAACQTTRDYKDWTVLAIPSIMERDTSTGILNVTCLEDMLEGRYIHGNTIIDPCSIALVCVTHVPTNSGIVNPVYEVGRLVDQYNKKNRRDNDDFPSILYLVDACQSVGQMDVNAQEMKCHGLTGTGRKYLRGPRGTGFLYVPRRVAQQLVPNHVDHACAPVVKVPSKYSSRESNIENVLAITYKDGAARFEFWESSLANKLGLGEAVRVAMEDMGLSSIAKQCSQLAQSMQERLKSIPSVFLHHENKLESQHQCGIVTFAVKEIDASVIKEHLWSPQNSMRFEVSTVPATSTPLDSAQCHVPDLVRASLSYTNTLEEIEAFCERLEEIISQVENSERDEAFMSNS